MIAVLLQIDEYDVTGFVKHHYKSGHFLKGINVEQRKRKCSDITLPLHSQEI